jgi:catechol-2,3-dioxygenase
MIINHLDLCVADVLLTTGFFETYLDFHLLSPRNAGLNVLQDETKAFTLVVSQLKAGDPPEYPKQFHIGFHFETAAEVDGLYAKLAEAPISERSAVLNSRRGYMFYFRAPGGILVEVSTKSSVKD